MNELQDLEAEQAVLSYLLNKPDGLAKIDNRLTAEDFARISHQIIFKGISDLNNKNKAVDRLTLIEHLRKSGELEKAGGITYISNIDIGFYRVTGIDEYIRSINEMSKRRYFAKLAAELREYSHDMTCNIETIENGLADALESVRIDSNSDVAELKELLLDFHAKLNEPPEKFYKTGFRKIDQNLEMKKGNLVILAARPAMGKTALALNFIANVCKAGGGVMFFSLEMSTNEIMNRLTALMSNIKQDELRREDKYDSVLNGSNRMFNWNLGIVESGQCSIHEMRTKAKIRKKKKGLDLIVIDYLQLMSADGYANNRTGEISYITRNLKLLAKEIGIPILVLSQLSRAPESYGDKRPMLSHLRDSGSIEQDADAVLLMYRDRYYNENGDDWTEINIAKNRHGKTGVVKLDFYPETSKFYDYKFDKL